MHEAWLRSPAAIAITLAHVTLGSIGSAWLSRTVPRLLRALYTNGWLSTTTGSIRLTMSAPAWLGHRSFDLIPNRHAMTGLDLGLIGLFLGIPASMYFRQLGRFLSW